MTDLNSPIKMPLYIRISELIGEDDQTNQFKLVNQISGKEEKLSNSSRNILQSTFMVQLETP